MSQETQQLLQAIGVTEPALSEFQDTDPQVVKDWLAYISFQDNIYNPAGYLIVQLRNNHQAPSIPDLQRTLDRARYEASNSLYEDIIHR